MLIYDIVNRKENILTFQNTKIVLELIMLEQNKLQVDLNTLITTATSLPATSCSLSATSFGHDRI